MGHSEFYSGCGDSCAVVNRLTNGAAVRLTGKLVKSPGSGQSHELVVDEKLPDSIVMLGECDPEVSLCVYAAVGGICRKAPRLNWNRFLSRPSFLRTIRSIGSFSSSLESSFEKNLADTLFSRRILSRKRLLRTNTSGTMRTSEHGRLRSLPCSAYVTTSRTVLDIGSLCVMLFLLPNRQLFFFS